jgi:hypothetical protein
MTINGPVEMIFEFLRITNEDVFEKMRDEWRKRHKTDL